MVMAYSSVPHTACPKCQLIDGLLVDALPKTSRHCFSCGTQLVKLVCVHRITRLFIFDYQCGHEIDFGSGNHCSKCGGNIEYLTSLLPGRPTAVPVPPMRPVDRGNRHPEVDVVLYRASVNPHNLGAEWPAPPPRVNPDGGYPPVLNPIKPAPKAPPSPDRGHRDIFFLGSYHPKCEPLRIPGQPYNVCPNGCDRTKVDHPSSVFCHKCGTLLRRVTPKVTPKSLQTLPEVQAEK